MLDGYFYQNEPITPDSAALKRKLALAMQAKGMDFSPVRSGWEGAARMAQALAGALDERMIDAREADAQKKANDEFSKGLSGALGGSTSPAAAPAAAPAAPAVGTSPVNAPETFKPLIQEASRITGVPESVLTAQIQQESRFNPNAVGGAGEVGLTQILPSTARSPGFGLQGVDPGTLRDPRQNILFGAQYLAARAKAAGLKDWNDPQQVAKALGAYNGGGDPNYASNVMRYMPKGAAPTQTAQAAPASPADVPAAGATPTEYRTPGQPAPAASGAPAPAQNPYAGQLPWAMSVLNNPYSTQAQKMIAQGVLQKAMTSPESFSTFKNEDGDWVQRNNSTGQLTMLKQAPNREQWHREGNVQVSESGKAEAYPDQTPEASKKLNDALTNWKQYHLPDPSDPKNGAFWQDFGSKVMGGAGQTINNTVQNATNPILEGLSTQFAKSREDAQGAADTVRSLHSARQQLEGGIIAGAGADQRLALQKVGALLGVADPSSIVNTETFRTQLKPVVLSTVKGLGAGSGISNADRDFALEAVGGSINLDEKTISRVLDITERAARAKIDRFNKQSQKMLETQPTLSAVLPMMTVDQPEEYQPQAPNAGIAAPVNGGGVIPGSTAQPIPSQPQNSGGPLQAARDAISRGAPRDKVIERLKANGIDPSGL